MGEVSTIGLDIAESVFQIHGVDVWGAVVMRRRITRAKLLDFFASLPACLVGVEACPSAHYWSRRLGALGHTVRLLPPSYLGILARQYAAIREVILAIEKRIHAWHRSSEES